MTKVTLPKKISKATQRAQQIREEHWGDVPDSGLWNRKMCQGYTTIPRTMPIIANIIDRLSKDRPAGRTYMGLWTRAFDASVVMIDNPTAVATEAGYSGERAVTTWSQRMQTLEKLGFIHTKPGSSGKYHYVLILNPHKVVWKHKAKIQEQTFMQLQDRAAEIGAVDMKLPAAKTKAADEKEDS